MKIKEGDVIKFGKIVFKITTLNIKDLPRFDRFKSSLTKQTGAEGLNFNNQKDGNLNSNLNNNENPPNKLIILNSNTMKTVNMQPKDTICEKSEKKK